MLKRPSRSDQAVLGQMVERAADAVEAILADGPEAAMTRFNGIGDADASDQEASSS